MEGQFGTVRELVADGFFETSIRVEARHFVFVLDCHHLVERLRYGFAKRRGTWSGGLFCGCDVSNEIRIGLRIGGVVVGGQIRFAAFNKRQVVFRRSECRQGSVDSRCQHGADGRGVMRSAAACTCMRMLRLRVPTIDEVAELLERRAIPFLVVSGYGSELDLADKLDDRAFLAKPASPAAIMARIAQIISGKRGRSDGPA